MSEPQQGQAKSPKRGDEHDIVVVAPSGEIQQIPIDIERRIYVPKVEESPGEEGGKRAKAGPPPKGAKPASDPFALPLDRPGGRKALAIAAPKRNREAGNAAARKAEDPGYGPAFGIAPTRPEPSAQNGTCIIINQHNVVASNPWTAARLNNEPQSADDYKDRLPAEFAKDAFEVLLAGPLGKVYYVSKAPNGDPAIREVKSLGHESELWYQLRNGLVAGTVPFVEGGGRIVPLVNVTSLMTSLNTKGEQ